MNGSKCRKPGVRFILTCTFFDFGPSFSPIYLPIFKLHFVDVFTSFEGMFLLTPDVAMVTGDLQIWRI